MVHFRLKFRMPGQHIPATITFTCLHGMAQPVKDEASWYLFDWCYVYVISLFIHLFNNP